MGFFGCSSVGRPSFLQLVAPTKDCFDPLWEAPKAFLPCPRGLPCSGLQGTSPSSLAKLASALMVGLSGNRLKHLFLVLKFLFPGKNKRNQTPMLCLCRRKGNPMHDVACRSKVQKAYFFLSFPIFPILVTHSRQAAIWGVRTSLRNESSNLP